MPKRNPNVSDKNTKKNGQKTKNKITTMERGVKVMICSNCIYGRRFFYCFKKNRCYSSYPTDDSSRCYWSHPTCSCFRPKNVDEIEDVDKVEDVDEDFEVIGEICIGSL